ncbi:Fc.00g077360.m01.CDS01 [Cosmosporella sp. VM-42]
MPLIANNESEGQEVIFPPVTKDHISNCSYNSWFPKYRSSCIKSRIIPLPPAFVSYLQEDGIILADDDGRDNESEEEEWQPSTTSTRRPREPQSDSSDDEDEPERSPPNQRFPETHQLIKDTIAELGGAVAPKLNWSSPKDAQWISSHQNTLKCTTPNDIYLLLKSSSFISHDLVHAFDGCTPAPLSQPHTPVLVLRPFFNPHVAMEFRCFVKHRTLIGISQRDLNHYSFLEQLRPQLWRRIKTFFREKLRFTFPDASFVFDVYISENSFERDGLGKIRLIDINPWAPRTDSLLFTWQELIEMEVRKPLYGSASTQEGTETSGDDTVTEGEDEDDTEYRPDLGPEFRILEKGDAATYHLQSSQYSAHKLPKEVVDASLAGEGGLREFAMQWKEIMEGGGDGMWDQAAQPNS